MAILEVERLRKEYGGFTAVEGSTFSIDRGEVFGVVGPNGAGKTTTLKMLAGLVEPTDGTAVVAGYTPGDRAMQRKLGFLPEESPLYEEMTATDYLEFFADLYDVPGEVASERIASSLDRLDLEHRDRRIGNMSKGMKRKVAIARALINDPEVLIFDEPASGLDPLTTNHVIEFTEELSEEGKTVVFSAHNLFHVESVCDRVVIMNDGRIVARGSVEEIRDDHGGTEYHVYATVDAAEALEDVSSVPVDDEIRHVAEEMEAVETIREAVADAGGQLTDIQTKTPSLEEIFLEVASSTEEDAERRQDSEGEKREQVVDT
ncbi:ABC transporter ATP-binding protein [Natronobacterium gregoryi]|uniref:ABC transporter ATP-binding protein n=2 Tax=Natronobacterium gregoryi TaxID=44930 RepID=L0AJH4_NATGS|nr:ABC transporter ATP-binding protein [Natronobacterium gregoryi]AFZ73961.1 ABC-type multidrug transport system, ATPase component [Natronobacterium gregoryi SP2]ELY71703.1 sulfate-transporting ATPase [Natronobacterium gregoryi SP2]PLK19540.1 ABC transporter ATP-binding protein [Natronobacterium gregoryi SP2]SFJ47292.1 ABC-2 type transport system ATP-binding protein [Natronobacterium gregoryi]